jgi:protein-disulfide isomerase
MTKPPAMTAPKLTRRDALMLAGVAGGGYAAARLMQAAAPLGRDVSGNMIAMAALDDPNGPSGGAADGDLVMAVYTDYRCPACRQAHRAMTSAVANDGKVRIIYKDYPIFGIVSETAAAYAIASDTQKLYEPLHDRLMTGPATVNRDDIRTAIIAVGGDWDRLESDRQQQARPIAARLARIANEAFGLGIAGTPGYLIGRMLVNGALDEGEFRRVFRDARSPR